MKHRIITISREFGSGGRTIGKEVAPEIRLDISQSSHDNIHISLSV